MSDVDKIFANDFERIYPTSLSIGYFSACALMSDTSLRCWGDNFGGQLGTPTGLYDSVPHAVPMPLTGAVRVAVANWHACALMASGGVKCWGSNFSGQLGLGNVEADAIYGPTDVPGLVSPGVTVVEIAVGKEHTCALLSTSTVKCWGLNQVEQAGQPNPDAPSLMFVSTPTEVDLDGAIVTHIFAGAYHSCASTLTGTICWGTDGMGELGRTLPAGEFWDMPGPSVPEIVGPTAMVSGASADHACAAMSDFTHQCWGRFESGQLGDGTADPAALTEGRPTASMVLDDPGFESLGIGALNSCGIFHGAVWCWGDDGYEELTEGAPPFSAVPFATSITTGATHVVVGAGVVCAIVDDRVLCWGINNAGILGRDLTCGIDQDPNACTSPFPVEVHGF
jgi:alpha-tubulin suppressor-like RCC1 family protein